MSRDQLSPEETRARDGSRANESPLLLKDVLVQLCEDIASDPEADEWNEWARKMLAANRDDQAGADPPQHLDQSEEREWERPRKSR